MDVRVRVVGGRARAGQDWSVALSGGAPTMPICHAIYLGRAHGAGNRQPDRWRAALLRPDADRPISAHMGLRCAGSNNVGRRAPTCMSRVGRTPNPTSAHCTADSAVSHRPGARTMRAGPCFLSSLNAQRRCATIAS